MGAPHSGARESAYKRFAEGKTLAQAEFTSAEPVSSKGPRTMKHCAGKFCGGCFTGKYPIEAWRKPQRTAHESGLDAGAACMCAPPWKRADDQAPAFAAGLCKSCIKDGRL